jgi:hypothetical protein
MSSPTKILDNAIVGYCVRRGLKSENSSYQKKKRAENQLMVRRAKELGIWDAIEAEAAKRADAVRGR